MSLAFSPQDISSVSLNLFPYKLSWNYSNFFTVTLFDKQQNIFRQIAFSVLNKIILNHTFGLNVWFLPNQTWTSEMDEWISKKYPVPLEFPPVFPQQAVA